MWDVIILLGAPGSGKGTTASDLTAIRPELRHVSTGNMLRDALQSGSSVGKEAKRYMESGELVPDEVVMRIVSEHLSAGPEDQVYLFDGFPRTDRQARLLDEFLEQGGQGRVTWAFLLEVDHECLVERIAGRLICRDCGAVYHLKNMPPKVEGVCDKCGGELYQRADDQRETVLNRLAVYDKQTAPLISYYEQQGVLMRVNGMERRQAQAAILAYLGGDAAQAS
jgi:adenylate kinase